MKESPNWNVSTSQPTDQLSCAISGNRRSLCERTTLPNLDRAELTGRWACGRIQSHYWLTNSLLSTLLVPPVEKMEAPCVTRPNGPNCGLIWPRHPPQGWEHSSLLWQSLTSASTITLLKIYCAVHERWQRKFSPQHSKVCFAIHLPFIVHLKKLK